MNSIEMYQRDAAGNAGAARISYLGLDTTAPDALTLTPSKSGDLWLGDSLVIGGREAGASWSYRFNGDSWKSGSGDSIEFYRGNMPAGDAVVEVKQWDRFINESDITSIQLHFAPPVI